GLTPPPEEAPLRARSVAKRRNVDQFAQAWWQWSPRWSLLAGACSTDAAFWDRPFLFFFFFG
ncbi:hypothetical protein K4H02_27990, partial [Mycobacterium tuberculosis]|nr:hypothetical protein [Mycobacterium tuberculosis]